MNVIEVPGRRTVNGETKLMVVYAPLEPACSSPRPS